MHKRATITSKGQITVPREVRRMPGVRSGDKLLFESDGKGVWIRPIKNRSAFYDLWYLTSDGGVEMDHWIPAIREKLEFRGQPCRGLQPALARKEARLGALWTTRLAPQMVSLPPFGQVFRALRRTLPQADLP